MSWDTSDRRRRLPPNWGRITARILSRDGHRCQLRYADICTLKATQVDHIIAGDNHSPKNLQAVCAECHASKSGREGADARWGRRYRPAEKHPGMIDDAAEA